MITFLPRNVHLNPVQVGRWKKRPVSRRGRPEDVTYRRKGAPLEPGEVLESVAEGLGVDVGAFRQR